MRYIALIAALLLTACAAGPQAQEKGIVTACNAYASALTTAATLRANDQLTESQVATVNSVVTVVSPVCNADSLPSTQEALAKVQSGVQELATINTQVQE